MRQMDKKNGTLFSLPWSSSTNTSLEGAGSCTGKTSSSTVAPSSIAYKKNHVEHKYLISRSSHYIIIEGQLWPLTHNGSPNTLNITGQISNYSNTKGNKKGPDMQITDVQVL